MLNVIFLSCFCVGMNLPGLTEGKSIAGLQPPEHPKVTAIQLPRASISGKELVALAQYVMRIMASRINITLESATGQTDLVRYSDRVQENSATVQSTTPPVVPSKDYETFVNRKQIDVNELTRCTDQKLQYPCRTAGGRIISRINGPGHPSMTWEQFVRYAERNIEPFPNDFGFEFIPTSEISPTYIPRAEKSTGVLPLMEQIVNSPPFPSSAPITPTGKEELSSQNVRIRNLTIERNPSSQTGNTVTSVPFEAIITFTKQKPRSENLENQNENIAIPTRNPPDDFPPYFDAIQSVGKKMSDSSDPVIELTPSTLDSTPEKNINPVGDAANEVVPDIKQEASKPMKKRQTPKVAEILQMLGLSTKPSKGSRRGVAISPTPSPPSSSLVVEPSGNEKPKKFTGVTLEEFATAPPKKGPTFQRQEFDEDEDEDEHEDEGGSLGSITDLLPLIAPIIEDLSDPNTETDIAELIEAGLPFLQDISQGDGENEGIDFVGLLSPVIASLSGPNRNGNGTVFQAILPLILPLVTPFIGPIVGPILQGSSNPADQGGSSITPLIQAVAGPLSLPTQPGGISIASSLISGIIASLSKDLKSGPSGGSDIGALVSTLVSGVIAGGSAGIRAKLTKPPPPGKPVHPGYAAYGQAPVPASSVDPLDLVGTSIKEILGLTLELVKSVVSSVTGILGASSAEQPRPVYGPANSKSRIT